MRLMNRVRFLDWIPSPGDDRSKPVESKSAAVKVRRTRPVIAMLARLESAWRRHGTFGFLRLAVFNVVYYALPRRTNPDDLPDELDEKYGTETSGIREVGALDVDVDVARHATRYQPSSTGEVRREIQSLDITPSDFTFIDYGSGKGRVLLIAAEFPFREVVGIEFSQELHDIATANIARLPASMTPVRAVHGDAAKSPLPEGNLVCFLHNPFRAPVMKPVVERLIAHRKAGNRIIAIYRDPKERAIFENSGIFFLRKDTPITLIFDTLLQPNCIEITRQHTATSDAPIPAPSATLRSGACART